MLGQGFKEQIYDVYRYLPPETQVVLISATLMHDVLEMSSKFMTDPMRVLVKRDELTLEGIKQFFVAVEKEQWKFDTLCDLYDTLTITQAVIFCNTRRKVPRDVTCSSSGFLVAVAVPRLMLTTHCAFRSTGSPSKCASTTSQFRPCMAKCRRRSAIVSCPNFAPARGANLAVVSSRVTLRLAHSPTSFYFVASLCNFSRVLITTDVWGRGLDVQQVSLVINYDLPESRELYIHRCVWHPRGFVFMGVCLPSCPQPPSS